MWEFYARRLAVLADAEPNDGHLALARLEQLGLVEAVITQNVDGLHQRAGSSDVLEVHGSIRSAVCLRCGAPTRRRAVLELLPLPVCECGEILKPGVVMFGELLPVATRRVGEGARAAAPAAARRRLLARGVSRRRPSHETLSSGGCVAIVNRDPTPLDDRAELRLDGSAGAVLRETVSFLE